MTPPLTEPEAVAHASVTSTRALLAADATHRDARAGFEVGAETIDIAKVTRPVPVCTDPEAVADRMPELAPCRDDVRHSDTVRSVLVGVDVNRTCEGGRSAGHALTGVTDVR